VADSPAEVQGFDQVVARLRAVVDRLEAGSLSLEEALQAFEDGVRLTRRGQEMLDAAEQRVEILLRAPAQPGEAARTGPFPPPENGAQPQPQTQKDKA
jgi:exodeoxyribonuclease VII small subunit